jgi:inositol-phosphate phosphatase/L-galactose 1-phosphate phosphatase/histidinol-phosphatase
MSEFVQFAHELADASGKVIRKYYRSKMTVEDKADDSPVTIADRQTETVLRNMISAKYPEHDILGEEHGYEPTGSSWKWVLDPIDGTRSFVAGMPIFGTLISLLEDEVPQFGIIDIPIMRERWLGIRNKESLFYPDQKAGKTQPCKVSGKRKLEQSILYSADPVRYGGDCYSYGLLASGHIDLVVEADLKIYDVMALVPVVENAGGVITDWQGNNAFDDDWDGCLVAAGSSELHAQALSLLQNT